MSPETIQLIKDLAPFGTAIATVFSGLWVALTYFRSQRESYAARLFESRKPFLDLQLKLYVETAQVAGKLAVGALENDEWRKVVVRFWELYWSELAVVEDEEVEKAMDRIGDMLGAMDNGAATKAMLEDCVLDLAHTLRDGIRREWGAHIASKLLQISASPSRLLKNPPPDKT